MRVAFLIAAFSVLPFTALAQDDAADPEKAGPKPSTEKAGESNDPPDPASDPPPRPVALKAAPLNTRVSGQAKSELFMSQRMRMRSIGGGRYAVRSENVYPFYQTVRLRADEIGHPGLSLHFEGWAGLDLGALHFDQRFAADPTYLYLQFHDYGFNLKLGRQKIYSGAARGLNVDGGYISYETPIHLGIEGYGGMVVSPYRGPDWYRDSPDSINYDDYREGLTDWEREGDYALGARVFYRVAGKFAAGVSVLHVTELEEVQRQLLSADLDMTPHRVFALSGNVTMDLFTTRLRDARAAVDIFPLDSVTVMLDYSHVDPTLYLSHMSIFSVFSVQEHDTVGGTVSGRPLSWLELGGGYHHYFYGYLEEDLDEAESYGAELDTGQEIEGFAVGRFGEKQDRTLRLGYRRIFEGEQGVHALRLGGATPFLHPAVRLAANLYADFYDEAVSGRTVGIMGDAGLYYGNEVVDFGGSVTAGATPYATAEVRGMVRLSYRFDLLFAKEVPR